MKEKRKVERHQERTSRHEKTDGDATILCDSENRGITFYCVY